MLDRIDKEILRLLLKYKGRLLTIRQISKKIKISPLTVKRHITKLEEEGYVIVKEEGKVRKYVRKKTS